MPCLFPRNLGILGRIVTEGRFTHGVEKAVLVQGTPEKAPFSRVKRLTGEAATKGSFFSRRFDERAYRRARPEPDLEGRYFFFPFFWEDAFWTRWASGESFKKMAK